MADEKKSDAKSGDKSPTSAYSDPFAEIVWLILAAFIVVYIINDLIAIINSGNISILGYEINISQKLLVLFLLEVFSYVKYVAVLLSILSVISIIYLFRKLTELRIKEAKKYYVEKKEFIGIDNPQWEKILNHTESTSESDWRLAILEADIMLDTLLDNTGLPGETMADKLKAVEKSDFTTIDNAWEAHKVRNQIAHEGATFTLSQHETKRVIGLYQTVFEEFKII